MRHAVVEVGLGGRLDATNVVEPHGDGDHLDQLRPHGRARAHSGGDRGREGGHHQARRPDPDLRPAPEALEVIARIAAERGAPLLRVGPAGATDCDYTYHAGAATSEGQTFDVRDAARRLCRSGAWPARRAPDRERDARRGAGRDAARARAAHHEAAIRQGCAQARWPARLQVVGRAPWIVVDGAHNADSFARLFAALRRHFAFERLILVIGVLADKDLSGIATAVADGGVDLAIATTVASPRALPAAAIAEALHEAAPELETRVYARSAAALAEALREAGPSDLICVTGSVYFAGEALRWLAGRPEVAPGAIEIAGVDH